MDGEKRCINKEREKGGEMFKKFFPDDYIASHTLFRLKNYIKKDTEDLYLI